MRSLAIAVAALGLLGGCATARTNVPFPVGLYDVPSERFHEVSAAGFNTVIAPVTEVSLQSALTNGLKIVGNNLAVAGARRDFNHHKALWGWYLFDEPDLHLVSPTEVARLNRQVHRTSRKPTLVVVMSGAAVEKYRATADFIGLDWYPVPWAPVATVAREMRLARMARQGEPFFAVLQAFNWSTAPELLRTEIAPRDPTFEEIRCMTYLALVQGAGGLFYYTFDNRRWKLSEHPALWADLSDIARDVRQNAPIFGHRLDWWPAETQYHGPPAEMYNEIMEARMLLTLHHVEKKSGLVRPGYYLVAVNTSAARSDFSFKLPFTGVEEFETSCGSDFQVDGAWIRKTYDPFEVCIFGPIHGQLAQ